METNLKVKYIPPKMTQEELYSLFSSIGEVESCKLIKNKITGQSEGYGFIIYHQAEDAKKAINKFNGFKVLQETLRVSYARSTTESFNKLGLKQYHNVDNSKTNLIVNYIPDSMTQEEFQLLFSGIGEIVHCKLIIDKVTGQSESYGFVTYSLPEDAEKAINILNGLKVLNKSLKVSYARPSSNLIKGANLYVTKLPRSMTQKDLEELFSPFGRIVSCRLLCDNMSIRQFVPGAEKNTPGISRGTAFVRFDQRIEAENAVQALNGALINGNNIPLIVRFAKRDNPQFPLYYSSQVTFTQEVFRSWNIYIAGLSPVAKENILWSLFGQYGAIQSVKVVRCRQSHYCRGFGYVRMANFNEALMAVQCLNGYFLDNQPLQVRFKIDRISGFHQQHYEAERSASWGYCQMDYLRSGYQNLTYSLNYIFTTIQNYAWYMVFGGLAFYYIYTKFLRPILESNFLSYQNYKKQKEEREYAAKYHKDPDIFSARISAQQNRAQKLQEQYDQEAREYQAKLKEREERKKQEVLNLLNKKEGGHRLGGDDDNKKPKSLRSEYNPLMGPGSSSNYRPPKRSKCGGGGCGK